MGRPLVQRVYPEHRFGGFTRHDGTVQFYTRVQSLLAVGQTVLDVGCGRGEYQDDTSAYRRGLRILKRDGLKVIGIDVDDAASANPYLDEFRLIEDLDTWPVEDESVDVVVSDYVLEHVANPDRFFSELTRVLKPGGIFCARTPNAWSYVGILARLIPNRLHAKVTGFAQEGRKSIDVFPTVYACNTRRSVSRYLRASGLEPVVYRFEPEPTYASFSPVVYRLTAWLHRLLPPPLQSQLMIFASRA